MPSKTLRDIPSMFHTLKSSHITNTYKGQQKGFLTLQYPEVYVCVHVGECACMAAEQRSMSCVFLNHTAAYF